MSTSQPEVKNEENKTRRSKAKTKLIDYVKNIKNIKGIKKIIPKKKEKPVETPSGKLTRKQQKAKQKAELKKNKKPRRRAFPIWLRIIIVLLLCAIAVVVGAMVGFGVIGSGKPSDALDMDTWRHIFEIITKTK